MTPRQIIAQFKTTLIAIAGDTTVGSEEREHQMTGALALACRLIRFHPQLSAKGATRPHVAELKKFLATHSCHESRDSAEAHSGMPFARMAHSAQEIHHVDERAADPLTDPPTIRRGEDTISA